MNVSVILAVVIGVALLGAVAALVLTEFKPSAAAPPRPVRAEVTGREALDTIDLGLRSLAAECVRANRPLPDAYAVVYSGDRLRLRLAGADRAAPGHWRAEESGEQWVVDSERLDAAGLGPGLAHEQPYSLAVTIGLDDGERVLVDLSRASTAIAVTGTRTDVQKLVRSFLTELITGPVGRRAEVTLVGSAATSDLTIGLGLQSARLRTAATLDEALAWGVTETAGSTASFPSAEAVTQVFRLIEGSSPVGVQGHAPRLFILEAAQFPEEQHAMKRLYAGDALIVIGDAPESGWRFQVLDDGSLDTGPLGLKVSPHAGRLG
ncbi:hypothetical protein [Streptomyces sp. NPDC000410]|uniref:hypothetical protein n=1 Tax=Streptomyces sp. NPDC000410 TaxID=3154254 RepID=UPI003317595C